MRSSGRIGVIIAGTTPWMVGTELWYRGHIGDSLANGRERALRRIGRGEHEVAGGHGFVFDRVIRFGVNEFGVGNGFVWYFLTEGMEALEFLDGATVLALGLGLVAKQEIPGRAGGGGLVKAQGNGVVVGLRDGVGAGRSRDASLHGVHEEGREEAGFDAVGAEEVELAEGDALDGEDLLRILRLVEVEGVGAEVLEGAGAFEDGHVEGGAGKAVLARVLGGAGLTGGGAGSGGSDGVGPVGGELFFGDLRRHGEFDVARRQGRLRNSIS